ncbi:alkaline phosphatase [Porphyromonas pogonae]|uniref:alkaline phosphatase n=1 Tax=Porphyromonas pogonae TaxID=867595 RepID=UPI002E759DD7|nr:alkaline phosphatase [Porphyromonas pogonae]
MKELKCLLLAASLLCLGIIPLQAQHKQDTEATVTLEKTYEPVKVMPIKGSKVKNVVFMIGDGMSLAHVYTLWVANKGRLNLENAQTIGLSKTYCTDKLITDSGASGTAMATGHKTKYHMVGTDPDGKELKSITTYAREKGLSSGVISVCRLYDATPAAYCCHNVDREDYYDIAKDYLDCNVDFILGGGANYFNKRPDKRDIIKEMRAKGYQTPMKWDDVAAIKSGKVFAVLDTVDIPEPKIRKDVLAKASVKAMDLLSANKKGFFLMVEGSQIDDYGHSNDLDMLMQEMADFDRTIGAVMKWAEKNGETLVVVTADHETGGLTLVGGDLQKGEIKGKFSTGGHSGVMVPVYVYGPGAEEFSGIYENTALFDKIKKVLNL